MRSTANSTDGTHEVVALGATAGVVRPDPARVSVVMPVRNAADTVHVQLAALAGQSWSGDWEVVVADNGSRDATRDRVEAFTDRLPLRVVDASGRRGIGVARNRGIAAATGDLLLFCDADDMVADDWLATMVAAARHADLVGGRLDPMRLNPPHVRDSRPSPQPGRLATAHRHLPYATGASLAIWRDVVVELGGFAEEFRTCGDDIDLSWRAQLAGHHLVYAPQAVTHYRYRRRTTSSLVQAFRYGLADTMLARRHGAHVPRPRLRRHARPLREVAHLLRGPAARRRWAWSASVHLGGLVAIVHPRTWLVPMVGPAPPVATTGRRQVCLEEGAG